MTENNIFTCPSCGHQSNRNFPRCPACARWAEPEQTSADDLEMDLHTATPTKPAQPASETNIPEPPRIVTGITEFDRVLGGGICEGSALLFTGAPGVGKSTLLMKVAAVISQGHGPVLYVTAEESQPQAAARARRIGAALDTLFLLADNGLEEAASEMVHLHAVTVVIDSLQLMRSRYSDNAPGTPVQVKEVSARLTELAKKRGIPMLVAGQIVKTGKFAGPMSVPHLYDGVFHLDESTLPGFILLRVEKNRFGSKTEVGSFRMTARGIEEVSSPSAEILKGGGKGIIAVAMEGTKPIATEIQVGFLQRSDLSEAIVGYPKDRLRLIQTILDGYGIEIPCGIALDVLGGYKINDPAADLAVAVAAVFAANKTPTPQGWAAIGEVALDGRVIPPRDIIERYREIEILGIPNILVPHIGSDSLPPSERLKAFRVRNLREALREIGALTAEMRSEPGRPKELRETKAAAATAVAITSAERNERKRAALAEKKLPIARPASDTPPDQQPAPNQPSAPPPPPELPAPSSVADPFMAQLVALAKKHPTLTADVVRRELNVSLQRAYRLIETMEQAR